MNREQRARVIARFRQIQSSADGMIAYLNEQEDALDEDNESTPHAAHQIDEARGYFWRLRDEADEALGYFGV